MSYYYDQNITVSWRFVDYALRAAGKLVYQDRLNRYKNASSLVLDAIEVRNDRLDDFIENYIESIWDWIQWDAYDIIDEWYSWDEKSYEEIRHQVWLDEYQDEDDDQYCKTYWWTPGQIEAVENWCKDNWYWVDSSYEVAVQDVFTYNN